MNELLSESNMQQPNSFTKQTTTTTTKNDDK